MSFLPVGMWRNSLGPWALLPGPSTPVMQNCASGNFSPSIAMNEIVPPSPNVKAELPQNAWDPRSTLSHSQGANAGAFHPCECLSGW